MKHLCGPMANSFTISKNYHNGIMKTFTGSPLLFVIAFALAIVGCDSPTAVEDEGLTDESIAYENVELTEMLTEELSLTSVQESQVETTIQSANTIRRKPGWEWSLAARLHPHLSEDQKAKLFRLTESIEESDVFGLVCFVGPGGLTGPDWRTPADFVNRLHILRFIKDILTDEQVEQIRTVYQRYHAVVRSLVQDVRAGNITREEFAAQLEELVASAVAEIRALLTDEQIQILTERLEARKMKFDELIAATKRAMYTALDATAEQIGAVESLCDRLTEEKDALFAQYEMGELNREELKSALNALNSIEEKQLQESLSEQQYEIVLIHKAITLRWRRIAMRRHRNIAGERSNAGDGGPLFGTSSDR